MRLVEAPLSLLFGMHGDRRKYQVLFARHCQSLSHEPSQGAAGVWPCPQLKARDDPSGIEAVAAAGPEIVEGEDVHVPAVGIFGVPVDLLGAAIADPVDAGALHGNGKITYQKG